jgi:hypothetical protein
MNTNIEGRPLAIVAGALFAAGTAGILLEDVIIHGAPMTLKHWITVVVIAGTIMVGHQVHKAWHSGLKGSALGFGVLFLVGTLLTVYSSVGRQAEHTMVASAEVEAADRARTRANKGLAEAETMLVEAQRNLASECKSGKGKRCEGIKATVDVYQAAATGYRAELEKLGPAKVATPEAKRAGELAAVFGANPTKVEAAMILVIPFLTTLFLELGSIICLGYGFRPVRKAPVNDNQFRAFDHIPEPLPPARAYEPEVKGTNVIEWAHAFEAAHKRKPRLDEAEMAFKGQPISRSTIYRRLRAA